MKSKRKKLVCGVGVNDADYIVQINEMVNGRHKSVWRCPFYAKWTNMLTRAYNKKYKNDRPTYENVSVCQEWLKFSNFKAWMETQDWEGRHLDKDILFPGNKEYSPEKCVFIDKKVNSFIVECDSNRGEYPIGVCMHKHVGKFVAQCSNPFEGRLDCLGYFNSPEEAHNAWLARKLEFAKLLAAEQTDARVANAIISRYENYLSNKISEQLSRAVYLIKENVTLLTEEQLELLRFNIYVEQVERDQQESLL